MIRYFCDRCGSEIDFEKHDKCLKQLKPLRIDTHGKYYFREKDAYLDLCFHCSCKFQEWLTEYNENLCDQDF